MKLNELKINQKVKINDKNIKLFDGVKADTSISYSVIQICSADNTVLVQDEFKDLMFWIPSYYLESKE